MAFGDFARLGIEVSNKGVKSSKREVASLTKEMKLAEKGAVSLSRIAVRAFGALAAGFTSAKAVSDAKAFNAAVRETGTLVSGSASEIALLEKNSRALSSAYGNAATDQVKAFYQAISAGAGNVSQATTLLDSANKLAIGGVTDVTTAVDGLTTAVNAYGPAVLSAEQAADAMFVGMKAGKTTIGDLARTMGNVIPIASTVGVSFDELVAGVAALTTQGQKTSVAVTGIRAILATIIKPTEQAKEQARALGLEFNAAALESKGMATFLNEVITATGGSKEQLGQLFGSVEALNAILVFSGGAGSKFTDILDQMSDKAGAADEAFRIMSEGLGQRLNVALSKIGDLVLTVGNALLAILVPAMELAASVAVVLNDNFDFVVATAAVLATVVGTRLAVSFGTVLVPALWAAVTGSGALTAALGILRTAVIATGFGALVVGAAALVTWFYRLVKATGGWGEALSALGELAASVWDGITTSAQAIPPALGAIWHSVAAGFATLMRNMSENWGRFLGNLASGLEGVPGMSAVFDMLTVRSGAAFDSMSQYDAAIVSAQRSAERLRNEARLLTNEGLEKVQSAVEKLRRIMSDNEENTDNVTDAVKNLKDALKDLETGSTGPNAGGSGRISKAKEETKKLTDEMRALESATDQVERSFGQTFSNIIRGSESARDAVSKLLDSIANSILTNVGTSLVASTGIGKFFGGLIASANGNVFSNGRVVPFASGGVVTSPTLFPMRGGNTGLMGEAGKEAIMPLKTVNGKLGVEATGGGGTVTVLVSVDENGNIVPLIENVSGNVAARAVGAGMVAQRNNTGGVLTEFKIREG